MLVALNGADSDIHRVGPFVVERRAGEGGMSVVFRATDPETGETVAVKVLERTNERDRARFDSEAQVLSSLRDERIVRYVGHGQSDDGSLYIAMEWLEGIDVAHRLRLGQMSVRDALWVVRGAALGLKSAHEAGVIHRDLKPSNLFLVGERVEDVRVIDFGLARSKNIKARLTATGRVVGTPSYMAPEQMQGEVSVRTDVYGLGATFFECLTGEPPFVGDHPGALLLAVLNRPAPAPSSLRADLPKVIDELVARMLAKDPAARPSDMNAVVAELDVLITLTGL